MIPLSKSPKVLEKRDGRGVFEIEALYPGYGVTIGNSLRRVLLSSLEGAAVTRVKIKGATHEFSTMEGVQEDVVAILLQLKKLRFAMHTDESQIAVLKVKGEKAVKASDFTLPAQLEIANKDLPIAHLTSKSAELEMEVQVEKGTGYVMSEARKREKEELGSIALDSMFSPVQKVSYTVDQMRVGERTDFDKLTIEIETDATVDPEIALRQASSILMEEYKVIVEGLQSEIKEDTQKEKKPATKKTTAKKTAKKAVKTTKKK